MELLPEIDGIFRAAAVTNAALAANTPELITTYPFKLARFKIKIITTTNTIFFILVTGPEKPQYTRSYCHGEPP